MQIQIELQLDLGKNCLPFSRYFLDTSPGSLIDAQLILRWPHMPEDMF